MWRSSCHRIMSFISSKSSYSLTPQIKSQSTIYFNNIQRVCVCPYHCRPHSAIWPIPSIASIFIKNSQQFIEKEATWIWICCFSFMHLTNWTGTRCSWQCFPMMPRWIQNEIITLKFASAGQNVTINIQIDSNRCGNNCFYRFYDFIIYRPNDVNISLFIDYIRWC